MGSRRENQLWKSPWFWRSMVELVRLLNEIFKS